MPRPFPLAPNLTNPVSGRAICFPLDQKTIREKERRGENKPAHLSCLPARVWTPPPTWVPASTPPWTSLCPSQPWGLSGLSAWIPATWTLPLQCLHTSSLLQPPGMCIGLCWSVLLSNTTETCPLAFTAWLIRRIPDAEPRESCSRSLCLTSLSLSLSHHPLLPPSQHSLYI